MEIYAEQCAFTGCNKLDFLPFKCDACSKTYCLEHRSYSTHNCPTGGQRDFTLIVCPKCKKGLRVDTKPGSSETVESVWAQHVNTPGACQVKVVKRCGAPGCKTKLTLTNKYSCEKCGLEVCISHRYEDDHACTKALVTPSALPRVAAVAGTGSANAKAAAKKRISAAKGGNKGEPNLTSIEMTDPNRPKKVKPKKSSPFAKLFGKCCGAGGKKKAPPGMENEGDFEQVE